VTTGLREEPGVAAVAELLTSRGAAGISHPGGTLLTHLERVHALLAQWGARPAVRRAGLCHAFYGTDGFATALGDSSRRDELATIIGQEAERLVYFYASCDRRFSYPHLAERAGPFKDRFTGTVLCPRYRCAGTSRSSPWPMNWISPQSAPIFAPRPDRDCSACSPHGGACSATSPGGLSRPHCRNQKASVSGSR
jgi:hypothetical protein